MGPGSSPNAVSRSRTRGTVPIDAAIESRTPGAVVALPGSPVGSFGDDDRDARPGAIDAQADQATRAGPGGTLGTAFRASVWMGHGWNSGSWTRSIGPDRG